MSQDRLLDSDQYLESIAQSTHNVCLHVSGNMIHGVVSIVTSKQIHILFNCLMQVDTMAYGRAGRPFAHGRVCPRVQVDVRTSRGNSTVTADPRGDWTNL